MLYRKLPTFLKDKAIPYMFKNFSESSGNMSKIDKIKKLFKIGNLSPENGHIFWLSCFSEDTKKICTEMRILNNSYLSIQLTDTIVSLKIVRQAILLISAYLWI